MKKQRGITLIALVVTIIILLILAGVTIMALTGEDGLINKINIARKKQLESEAEEKLKLKIMELQTNIIEKEGRQASLEDLNNWTNSESDYYDQEITSVSDSQENTNKLVELDGYIFEVDENLNIVGIIEADITSKTETTYQINSVDGEVMQVTIKIKNASGIEKVITPEGREIIPQTNKEEIAIDYEVTSGNNYTFKVKVSGSDEIKEYVLKADINAKPEIDQNESYAYPLLTEYGVEINKTVEIDYGENTNNYYSVDNGETWKKYIEAVKVQKECTTLARSIMEGEITREAKKEITLEIADDAIEPNAYDGDETTYTRNFGFDSSQNGYAVMVIDNSMQSKEIYVKYVGALTIKFWDKDGNELSYDTLNNNIIIPEDAEKMGVAQHRGGATAYLYEIIIQNQPVINVEFVYPTLTQDGIKQAYNNVKIEYFATSEQKLYSLDEGVTWLGYQDGQIIKLELGDTIIAKGMDKNNKETINSSYVSELLDDAIEPNAYDGDEATYTNNFGFDSSQNGYDVMVIDNSMQSKEIYVKYGGSLAIKFWDKDGNELSYDTLNNNIIIPEDAEKMGVAQHRGGATAYLYEIIISN